MRNKGQGGFTIIEVMLVLAVSVLLISTTVIGTYRMVFDARFKDVMMNAASWLQTQYEEARSGVRNMGCGTDAGTSNRVLLGKLIRFESSKTMKAYYVTGEDNSNDNYYYQGNLSGIGNVGDFSGLRVELGCESSKELDWQAVITNRLTYSSSSGDNIVGDGNFDTILLIRKPRSTSLETYFGSISDDISTINQNNKFNEFISEASGNSFKERAAVIIGNRDSNMFQSVGVVCIDPGANSTNVWGARGLEAPGAWEDGPLASGVLDGVVGAVRDKCKQ